MKHLLSLPLLITAQIIYPQEKPNILLIVADDLGYGDIGCYGATDIKTPNLDKLAEQGVRFTDFYANGPECSPTRTALLTGRYQQRVGGLECAIGIDNVGRYEEALALSDRNELGLPVEFNAIPSILNQKNYNTAIIGKWHVGGHEKFRPKAHGFDYSIGILGGGVDYFHHTEPLGLFLGNILSGKTDFYRNDILQERDGYYMTHLITDESVEWINIQNNSRPFFLYVPYTSPHTPIQGPNDYHPDKITGSDFGKGDKETYIEMIESLDTGIGKILEKLEEKGFAENTVVIFFSDNGATKLGSNAPLAGNKGQLYEGGIRVPCIIKWPGIIKPALVSDQMSIGMDLTASISKIIDGTPPKPFDGIDIIGHIVAGKDNYPRALFWRSKRGDIVRKAVRNGNWKYMSEMRGDITGEFLFNLETDIGETTNLKDKNKREFNHLKNLMTNWENNVKPERYEFFKKFE